MELTIPAAGYLALTIALSLALTYFYRRPAISALISATAVLVGLVSSIQILPWQIRYYVQDMIYEPMVRDIFAAAGETLLSASFHILLPVVLASRLAQFIPERNIE